MGGIFDRETHQPRVWTSSKVVPYRSWKKFKLSADEFQLLPKWSHIDLGSTNKMSTKTLNMTSDDFSKVVFDYPRSSPDSPWNLPTITKQCWTTTKHVNFWTPWKYEEPSMWFARLRPAALSTRKKRLPYENDKLRNDKSSKWKNAHRHMIKNRPQLP